MVYVDIFSKISRFYFVKFLGKFMVRLSGQIKGWSEFQSNYGCHLSALSCQISFSQNSVHFLTKRGISPTGVMQKLPQLKNSGSKLLSPWFWSNEKFERNFSDKMGNIVDIWSRWKSIFIQFIAGKQWRKLYAEN